METGIVDLAPFGPMVPKEVQDMVNAKKAEIIKGDAAVFAGPVKDQDGNVKVIEGATADDNTLLGMDWFVEGVIGTTK
jgi:basic membrane protein A